MSRFGKVHYAQSGPHEAAILAEDGRAACRLHGAVQQGGRFCLRVKPAGRAAGSLQAAAPRGIGVESLCNRDSTSTQGSTSPAGRLAQYVKALSTLPPGARHACCRCRRAGDVRRCVPRPLPRWSLRPPKSIILPNYDMVRIGQFEALESGAVIAQVSGPLANVYNAAGLAASDKTAVNASSTGYQLTNLGLEGLGQKVSSQQDRQPRRLPRRRPRRPGREVEEVAPRLLGLFPVELGAGYPLRRGGGPHRRHGPSHQLSLAGATARPRAVARRRLQRLAEASASGLRFRCRSSTSCSRRPSTRSSSPPIRRRRSRESSPPTGARGTCAARWECNGMSPSAISLGLSLATPTARLWGSSLYQDNTTTSLGSGFDALTFRDPRRAPGVQAAPYGVGRCRAAAGQGAARGRRALVQLHRQWDMYTSDSVGIAVSQAGGAPVETSPVVLAPVTMAYRSVVNFAIGGRIPLSSKLELHAGFNSDESPLATTDESFRKVNMIGGTIGLSLTGAKLSGSLGLGFQSGTSPETEGSAFRPSPGKPRSQCGHVPAALFDQLLFLTDSKRAAASMRRPGMNLHSRLFLSASGDAVGVAPSAFFSRRRRDRSPSEPGHHPGRRDFLSAGRRAFSGGGTRPRFWSRYPRG